MNFMSAHQGSNDPSCYESQSDYDEEDEDQMWQEERGREERQLITRVIDMRRIDLREISGYKLLEEKERLHVYILPQKQGGLHAVLAWNTFEDVSIAFAKGRIEDYQYGIANFKMKDGFATIHEMAPKKLEYHRKEQNQIAERLMNLRTVTSLIIEGDNVPLKELIEEISETSSSENSISTADTEMRNYDVSNFKEWIDLQNREKSEKKKKKDEEKKNFSDEEKKKEKKIKEKLEVKYRTQNEKVHSYRAESTPKRLEHVPEYTREKGRATSGILPNKKRKDKLKKKKDKIDMKTRKEKKKGEKSEKTADNPLKQEEIEIRKSHIQNPEQDETKSLPIKKSGCKKEKIVRIKLDYWKKNDWGINKNLLMVWNLMMNKWKEEKIKEIKQKLRDRKERLATELRTKKQLEF